ncbi:selenoprotein H [Ricinus communis]|uniref:Selenoprotein H n=1 Tax=Ricinus communis TaxID=3988 RepID=B9SPQ2_RICCO|nr:selenoprotein H [Ricinus communis]EEF34383.1 conserved hypothetical protein [Ricinus communis]|eukprot:XP_002527971.1 selenoprotein H [Ricinus communis]
MAPRKRKSEAADDATAAVTTKRVTRSSARLAKSRPAAPAAELPKKKKGKVAAADHKKAEKKEESVKKTEEADNVEEQEQETADGENKKTIVIEHCTQCRSFKTSATQVKNGLEAALPSVIVLLNPDKPRKGCFEIRKEGGEKFITLLGMKRPFKPMKDLDMKKVISDIIDKIK